MSTTLAPSTTSFFLEEIDAKNAKATTFRMVFVIPDQGPGITDALCSLEMTPFGFILHEVVPQVDLPDWEPVPGDQDFVDEVEAREWPFPVESKSSRFFAFVRRVRAHSRIKNEKPGYQTAGFAIIHREQIERCGLEPKNKALMLLTDKGLSGESMFFFRLHQCFGSVLLGLLPIEGRRIRSGKHPEAEDALFALPLSRFLRKAGK